MCALSEYCSNQHSTQISTKDSPSLPFFLHLMVLQFLYRCASNLALFVGINLLVLVTLRVRFFNVRTRGLCALVLPWADIAGGFATGYFLDQSKLSVKRRARLSWIFLMALNLGLWVWSGVLTKLLEGHGPGIDWTSGSIFNEIFALAIMFEFAALSTQTLIYWLISHSESDNDPAYRWILTHFTHFTTSVRWLYYSLLYYWRISRCRMCWTSCCLRHQVSQHDRLVIHWIEYWLPWVSS